MQFVKRIRHYFHIDGTERRILNSNVECFSVFNKYKFFFLYLTPYEFQIEFYLLARNETRRWKYRKFHLGNKRKWWSVYMRVAETKQPTQHDEMRLSYIQHIVYIIIILFFIWSQWHSYFYNICILYTIFERYMREWQSW